MSGVVAERTASVLQWTMSHYEDREIRTPNLLIWSQTRCRCAISPTKDFRAFAILHMHDDHSDYLEEGREREREREIERERGTNPNDADQTDQTDDTTEAI